MTNRPGPGRLSAVLACVLTMVCTHAQAQTSPTSAAPSATGLVDALNGVFGKQTYGRAIHAKGIVLEGTFTPSPTAASLTKAAHLQATPTPVTVRFSNFAGIPTIADTDGLATPRGMAIKFKLSDGSQTDIVTHSFNGFPSATAEEFRQLMIAVGTSGPGTPAPTPADTFLASHPTAKAFFGNLTPPPVSFATLPYFGVNSFEFTNARGEAHFGRYQLVPVAGTHLLPKADVATAGHDYLGDEIKRRIAAGPVEFLLQVQLSATGDAIDNPSIAWPDSRPTVKLGIIKINRLVADSDAVEKVLLFTPAAITDGIATADPMIEARNGAYSVSYGRRHSSK
jgi:catalase